MWGRRAGDGISVVALAFTEIRDETLGDYRGVFLTTSNRQE